MLIQLQEGVYPTQIFNLPISFWQATESEIINAKLTCWLAIIEFLTSSAPKNSIICPGWIQIIDRIFSNFQFVVSNDETSIRAAGEKNSFDKACRKLFQCI